MRRAPRRRQTRAEPLPAERHQQPDAHPTALRPGRRRDGPTERPPPPGLGSSHLPGTFAPLRFQNCFLAPSLAMTAVTSSPYPRHGPRPQPAPSGFTPPIPFPRNRTERRHLGTRKQRRSLFAPQVARRFQPTRSESPAGWVRLGQSRRGSVGGAGCGGGSLRPSRCGQGNVRWVGGGEKAAAVPGASVGTCGRCVSPG